MFSKLDGLTRLLAPLLPAPRLRAGRYRVLYEITGDVVSILHIARVTAKN